MAVWVSSVSSLLAAIIGGLVVHVASRRREVEKDRRAERLKYLTASFRVIMRELDKSDDAARERFDAALEDVTLFGTEQQVREARKIRHFRALGGPVDFAPLLESLRTDLRTELGLKPIPLFAQGDDLY